jgi:apolipoprotein N-acyltransferase
MFSMNAELLPAAARERLQRLALPMAAGALWAAALMLVSSLAALGAMILLAYTALNSETKRSLLRTGLLFGAISSLILNGWMVTVITDYVKGSVLTGLVCYAASALVPAIFFGLQLWLYGLMRQMRDERGAALHNAIIFACLWVLTEWCRGSLFGAMPWLGYSAGVSLAGNGCLVQLAALGGPWILSFMLVLAGCFTARAAERRDLRWLAATLMLVLLHFAAGAWLRHSAGKKIYENGGKTFTAVLLRPALDPKTVWDDRHADALVSCLFDLNKRAAALKPDLTVWTETTVPWTYAENDDFLRELTSVTSAAGVHTLIGMNSGSEDGSGAITNSVHLLDASGRRTGVYDKQELLSLVERPLFEEEGELILPFLAASGQAMQSGSHALPIATPWGKAGILLCNEATSPELSKKNADAGAAFMVNTGNDSWFAGSYIARQHFYNCRLRAVETRKDVVVNNNMGYSGLVRANGDIAAIYDASAPGADLVHIRPNDLPAANTATFVLLALGALITSALYNLLRRSKQPI